VLGLRAVLALPVSTAAVTALLVLAAQRQALLAQQSMMAAVVLPERLAVVVAAAVRLAGLERATEVAPHLVAVVMQEPVAQAVVAVRLVVQALSMVRAMVLVAVAVATSLAAAVTDLLAVCMALLVAAPEARPALVVRVKMASSSLSTARPFRLASVSREAQPLLALDPSLFCLSKTSPSLACQVLLMLAQLPFRRMLMSPSLASQPVQSFPAGVLDRGLFWDGPSAEPSLLH